MNRGLLGSLALPLLLASCVTSSEVSNVAPNHKPKLDSVEAGLWFQVEKMEKRLANSQIVERDAELNQYLNEMICRVSPDYCANTKLYILKQPYFNATMTPNGTMNIWVGLLLRAQNEDQLASVIGHEMAHYNARHSLKKWNNAKALTDFLAFFSIATGGIGFGLVGAMANVGAYGSLQAYSRELEEEADLEGLKLLYKANYDVTEAVTIWENVEAETNADKDATDRTAEDVFWATHPLTKNRIVNIRKWGEELMDGKTHFPSKSNNRFRKIKRKWAHVWVADLLKVTKLEKAVVVLKQQQGVSLKEAEVLYYEGEAYRRRGEPGDLETALTKYKEALTLDNIYKKTYRSMALVSRRLGDNKAAKDYFEQYLQQNPTARDKSLINTYIQQLRT
jgi:predicted Zn-dependent protease